MTNKFIKDIIECKENNTIFYIISENNNITHSNSIFSNNIIIKHRKVKMFKISGFYIEKIIK